MIKNKTNKAEEMKEMALEYLNNSYEDTFTAKGYSSSSWAYDYSLVSFTSKKYSDTVRVYIYEENGAYSFDDDYFRLTMKDDAEKYFESFISEYGYNAEVKVRFISLGASEINANAPFTDYAANGRCNMEVYFISGDAFAQSDVKAVLTDLSSAKIMGIFRFVVTNDSELLSQYSISEIVNEQADSILEEHSYSINSSFEIAE